MKISKYDILDGFTAGFGMSGAIALILGGGFCLGGLTATAVIKAGEFFSSGSPRGYQSMMFYGSAGAGAGLFLIGAGATTSHLRDKVGEEEMERISTRYEEAVQHSQVHPQNKRRTWAEWQEYEEIKKFCRGCQYYLGGGRCALYSESKIYCTTRTEKSICTNCRFYSGEELLPCAVHPLGLIAHCPDWQPSTDD